MVADSSAADQVAVRVVVEGIIAADNVEDIDAVLGNYAEDAVLIAPEQDDIVGREAIRRHYRQLFASVDLQIETRIEEIVIAGDWALVRGVNTVAATAAGTDTRKCASSKYLMSLRRTGAAWRIAHLIWNNRSIACGDAG